MKVRPDNTKKVHKNMMSNFGNYCKLRYNGRDSSIVFDEMVLLKNAHAYFENYFIKGIIVLFS